MGPATTFAAALLLSVSTGTSAEVRDRVGVPAALTTSVLRPQEADATASADAIGVIVFSNITGAAEDEWIGSGIAETLAADLAGDGALSVVGREVVSDALENLNSGQGAGAEATEPIEVRAGRLLGARWIISGAYQRLGDRLRITARVVEVASAVVIHTAKIDGLLTEVFALQDRLAADLRRGLPAGSGAAQTSAAPRAPTISAPANAAVEAAAPAALGSSSRPPLPGGGSHRTVQVLFTYGSSGQRISSRGISTAAGRFSTSPYPRPSVSWAGATICRYRHCSASDTSPRSAKYALRSPRSTAGSWLRAHRDSRP